MRILIISDAASPQINGVVETIRATVKELRRSGCEVKVIEPDRDRWLTIKAPFYPGVDLEFWAQKRISHIIKAFKPEAIHIATEGPLGWAAHNVCRRKKFAFTTAYHTRFPEYISARFPKLVRPIVESIAYFVLRRFHEPSNVTMVATSSLHEVLQARGFKNLGLWSRGVNTDIFAPQSDGDRLYEGLPRPIFLSVGRVAIEKSLPDFLGLPLRGSKVVIGDGPELAALKKAYPKVHFLGPMPPNRLAKHYAAADIFVFSSKTDTFGLVLLEACASGLPVAACPAPGPRDLFSDPSTSAFAVLDQDLNAAIAKVLALEINPEDPRAFAANFSWEACTTQFLGHLCEAGSLLSPKRTASEN